MYVHCCHSIRGVVAKGPVYFVLMECKDAGSMAVDPGG